MRKPYGHTLRSLLQAELQNRPVCEIIPYAVFAARKAEQLRRKAEQLLYISDARWAAILTAARTEDTEPYHLR